MTEDREVGHVPEPKLAIVALDELAGVELQGVRTRAREELRDLVDEAMATGWVGRPDPRRGIPERRVVGRLRRRERCIDEHEAPHGPRMERSEATGVVAAHGVPDDVDGPEPEAVQNAARSATNACHV